MSEREIKVALISSSQGNPVGQAKRLGFFEGFTENQLMTRGYSALDIVAQGWSRRIDQKEALEIARRNEEEGLVLMPGNEKDPSFMCACCSDCCGMLGLMKNFPKPAEVVGSNFYAVVQQDLCKGCATCVDRCPIDAIHVNGQSVIDLKRCIGCGLCVPTCPENAMLLRAKKKEVLPPKTKEEHQDLIYDNRNSLKGKIRSRSIKTMIRVMTRLSKGSTAKN